MILGQLRMGARQAKNAPLGWKKGYKVGQLNFYVARTGIDIVNFLPEAVVRFRNGFWHCGSHASILGPLLAEAMFPTVLQLFTRPLVGLAVVPGTGIIFK